MIAFLVESLVRIPKTVRVMLSAFVEIAGSRFHPYRYRYFTSCIGVFDHQMQIRIENTV
jgi:hypothetical protein